MRTTTWPSCEEVVGVRLLKNYRGYIVNLHIEGVTLRGLVTDVAGDSVALRDVEALTSDGPTDMPGPVVVSAASIVWAAVIP